MEGFRKEASGHCPTACSPSARLMPCGYPIPSDEIENMRRDESSVTVRASLSHISAVYRHVLACISNSEFNQSSFATEAETRCCGCNRDIMIGISETSWDHGVSERGDCRGFYEQDGSSEPYLGWSVCRDGRRAGRIRLLKR